MLRSQTLLLEEDALGQSLTEALGGDMSGERLKKLREILSLQNDNHFNLRQFSCIAGISERLFAAGCFIVFTLILKGVVGTHK